MGWTDDDIDNLYRNAVDSQKYAYQDVYWKEMEAMLDQQKVGKKRFIWWIPSTLVMLIGLGIAFYTFVKQHRLNEESAGITLATEKQTDSKLLETEVDKSENHSKQRTSSEIIESVNHSFKSKGSDNELLKVELATKQKINTPLVEQELNGNPGEQKLESVDELNNLFVHSDETTEGIKLDTIEQVNHVEDQLAEADSVAQTNLATQMFENPTPSKQGFFYSTLFAGSGVSYLQDSNRSNVEFGVKLGYEYQFNSNFKFGGGLGYRFQVADDLVTRYNQTYYGMKAITIVQSSIYDQLQFVDVNLHFHYIIRKFAVGIQLTPTYLFAQRSQQTIETVEKVDYARYEYNPEFVQSSNFNSFGVEAGLSMQYEFKKNLALEVNVLSRVTRLMGTSLFDGTERKFPIKVGVGITKRF